MIKELGDAYQIDNIEDYFKLCRKYGIVVEEESEADGKKEK